MKPEMFEFIDKATALEPEPVRPSMTYWQDAWRRLKKHKPALLGLIGVIIIVLFGFFGPLFSKVSYSDQNIDFSNLPPRMDVYQLEDDFWITRTQDYKLIQVSPRGKILARIPLESKDVVNKKYTYSDGVHEVVLDFSERTQTKSGPKTVYKFIYNGKTITEKTKSVSNKTFPFGTDLVGRNLLVRVMFGARISLTIAFVASIVNLLVGVFYGSLSAYEGGKVDNVMIRIVDLINSVPLILYIILIRVVLQNTGIGTMIFALVSVYWVSMARLVRGQVLSLKEQEFVLAAQALGVSRSQIIIKHLIPNAIGPIIVTMTMMIPAAVFTEAFISFIGLGVSAPQASWGTLANDALQNLLSYPYQLFYPALAIALTILSFNMLGDGLRDALDPRLRKG